MVFIPPYIVFKFFINVGFRKGGGLSTRFPQFEKCRMRVISKENN